MSLEQPYQRQTGITWLQSRFVTRHAVVVSSNKALRSHLARILREAGITVREHSSDKDPLTTVIEEAPGFIIMAEEAVSDTDSDLIQRIRERTEAHIIVVGSNEEGAIVRALFFGADAHASDDAELLARIRRALRNRPRR